MPDPDLIERARRLLGPHPGDDALDRIRKAVCDAARLRILQALGAGPLMVDELAVVIERKPTATSQHLRVLRRLNLVEGQRRGTAVRYSLKPDPATDEVLAVAKLLVQAARERQQAGRRRR